MLPNLDKIPDKKAKERIAQWLQGPYDDKTKQEILELLKTNPEKLYDAFYQDLSFGTGGMRGIMGVGSNRMNLYTVKSATQGLANYILEQKISNPSVVIGYDSRHHSKAFASNASDVLRSNGINVYLFPEVRPTPLVSFAIRQKKATAGIMITASHNPPEYNGYKVYWSDGAQVLPPHDEGIIEKVSEIESPEDVILKMPPQGQLISLDKSMDEAYLEKVKTIFLFPEINQKQGNQLKIVYTNLHGAGISLMPEVLNRAGFTTVYLVEAQKELNGDFPNAPKPNPEERQSLQLGMDIMNKERADLFIATDPDADRMAAVTNSPHGLQILTGNEIAAILLYHLCHNFTQQNRLLEKAAFIKSIVTTDLFDKIVRHFKGKCFRVLTGFKYIGQMIHEWEQSDKGYQFIFGAEESYGYLVDTFSRDKDGLTAAALLAEAALQAKLQHKTLYDLLLDIYDQFGVYREKLHSINFSEGAEGMKQIKGLMLKLRSSPPKHIGNSSLIRIDDYQKRTTYNLKTRENSPIPLPESNVLAFHLSDDSTLIIRPSGTEPKIKIYVKVFEPNGEESVEDAMHKLDERIKYLLDTFMQILHE